MTMTKILIDEKHILDLTKTLEDTGDGTSYITEIYNKSLNSYNKLLLKENDFLIARSGNTVGKTFLYKSKFGKAIYAGYLVKYKLNPEKVLPEYVLAFTKSPIFKRWVDSNQRVSGQPNINGQEYLEFPILIPPLDLQTIIVKKISKIREQIKSKKDLSEILKYQAITVFEEVIFNTNAK